MTMTWWNLTLSVILGLAVLIMVALLYGSYRWRLLTTQMHADLEAARRPIRTKRYHVDQLVGLPPPVQKYFRAVLKDGQPIVSAVHLELNGLINMSDSGDKWKTFTSTQRAVAQRPGFDWEGRIQMMPGLTARVHDAYIAGEGILRATLFGLLSVADLRGTTQMAHGELMRFFAEAAWYPTSLLPSQGVEWKGIDDLSASATLKDGDTAVTLEFRFGEDGLITTVHADARGRTVAGEVVPTPWEGHWTSYEWREGMRIPTAGEVAWVLPMGPKPYWRGRISGLRYEFAR
jgi:hypothetical protein